MGRSRAFAILLGAGAATVAVVRHSRASAGGRPVPGGILIADAPGHDAPLPGA
jgi:hypothetical protein